MRRSHRALWFCLSLAPASLLAADRSPCRDSRFPESGWTLGTGGERELKSRIDVDGDGQPDDLIARRSFGSGSGETIVTLSLSKSGRRVEAREESDFYTMIAYMQVPDALAANPEARRVVEEALFPRLCESPDPSLAWLLEDRHRLRWETGPPELPGNYAVYSTRHNRAVWTYYLGMNHDRGGDAPRVLATRGDLVLLGTAHGVILTNPARTRHAWILVTRKSEEKLRLPSVQGARFDGQTVVVETLAGPVRIDLRNGSVLP